MRAGVMIRNKYNTAEQREDKGGKKVNREDWTQLFKQEEDSTHGNILLYLII